MGSGRGCVLEPRVVLGLEGLAVWVRVWGGSGLCLLLREGRADEFHQITGHPPRLLVCLLETTLESGKLMMPQAAG